MENYSTNDDRGPRGPVRESSFDIKRIVLIVVMLLFTAFWHLLSSPVQGLVEKDDGGWHYASPLFVVGGRCICRMDATGYPDSAAVLTRETEEMTWAVVPVDEINTIKFISVEKTDEEKEEPEESTVTVSPRYLGTYQINASGHIGYIYLFVKDGSLRGSMRFPNWGKGAYEPMRSLVIRGNAIYFVRSATTAAELRRLGANSYFMQQYNGTYSNGGKTIKGFYLSKGAKNLWEANRVQ